MATIHRTTMTPTKLELLTEWLPRQAFYTGEGEPRLEKNAGFRLDDPEGEVGLEFMVVQDVSGAEPVLYHVPLTYRAAPLETAAHGLVGVTEHGVLGTRFIYDGPVDPVWRSCVAALFDGEAEPQAQSEPDTSEPRIRVTGSPLPHRAIEVVRRPGARSTADEGRNVIGFWFEQSRSVSGALLREVPSQGGNARPS